MSGKSTYGKRISKRFNKQFIDSDDEIVKLEGKTIPELFEIGENHFRKVESKVINSFSRDHNQVIACGGGVIKNKKNIPLAC